MPPQNFFCKNSCSEASFSEFWALLYAISPVSQISRRHSGVATPSHVLAPVDPVTHRRVTLACTSALIMASGERSIRNHCLRAYHSTAVAPRSELPTHRRAPTSENRSSRLYISNIGVVYSINYRRRRALNSFWLEKGGSLAPLDPPPPPLDPPLLREQATEKGWREVSGNPN